MRGAALFSPDGLYRYRLTRRWGRGALLAWIMLNPSTADGQRDDPTIRRCIGFSRSWGFGGLVVVNLFAFRATSQADLWSASDPVGPEADAHIRRACRARRVVLAWGAAPRARARAAEVVWRLERPVLCLGRTASGQPRHPLYTAGSARPVEFRASSGSAL